MSSVVILIWYGVMAVVAYISSCGQCVLSCESALANVGKIPHELAVANYDHWSATKCEIVWLLCVF